jgi:hypothetical protein
MHFSLKGGSFVLLACLSAQADAWTFFHPETVKSLTCKVELSEMQAIGTASHDVWLASASATRTKEEGNWTMTVGEFPPSEKGRHDAEKACSRWMDEASKRIRRAR